MGRLRLMPRMLARRAVQRHTAASRSASPWISVQHGVLGGVPRLTLISPLSTLAHTPSFSAFLGHLLDGGGGHGVLVGDGGGGGGGVGFGQPPHAATSVTRKALLATSSRTRDNAAGKLATEAIAATS